jgi:hypothetical protein
MRRRSGRTAEAVALLREAIAIYDRMHPEDPYHLLDLARAQSLLAETVDQPASGVSAAEGRALADKAMAALQRAALGHGVSDATLRRKRDFVSLRSWPDFQLLMLDLAMPAEPFATAE